MTNYQNILFDILVHGQGIAIPLELRHEMPLEAARTGAPRVWRMAGRSGREGDCAASDSPRPTSTGPLVRGRRRGRPH